MAQRAEHWDHRYQTTAPDQLSWFMPHPANSLAIVDRIGVQPDASVIDVGGGESFLVDRLIDRGFSDLTVLDISQVALDAARSRVGHAVIWQQADLLTWEPDRQWNLWHDRAVFHFFTTPAEQSAYRRLLRAAVAPGGHVILATFASDGPTTCSGLPVERYSPERLAESIGDGFDPLFSDREEHVTPSGAIQPFTWVAFQRRPDSNRATTSETG